jgi:nucleoside-diphosphate-sugar epimerase
MTNDTDARRANGETVIVTGSSGLIGSPVCRRLVERGFRVAGFDRPGVPHPPPEAVNVPCDLTDENSVSSAVETVKRQFGPKVASVVHLAAYYDFSGEDSPLYEELTVNGTRRLLRMLRDPGRAMSLEQFAFSSTMLVHAPCEPGQFITEDWPIEPTWAYPKSKVDAEQAIARERGDARAVFLRIAGVYDDACHSIPLAHQIDRIHRDKLTSRVYPGPTSHGQSFVHLDDVVESIVLTVERRGRLPEEAPILIGEPVTLSYDELQHTIARLLDGESFETRRVPGVVAKVGAWLQDVVPGSDPFIKPWMIDRAAEHYALDVSRAKQLLGWTPKRSLRETLPRMIEALRADPVKWYEENNLGEPPTEEHPRGRGEHRQIGAGPPAG